MKRTLYSTVLIAALFSSLASTALADGVQFATQTIFLSTGSPIAGSSILVHSSVVNTSSSEFNGQVMFKDGATQIGRVSISVAAGDAQVATISWKPTAGSHTLTASLIDSAGDVMISLGGDTQAAAVFAVAAQPPPPTSPYVDAASQTSSASLSGILSSVGSSDGSLQPSAPIVQTIDNTIPSLSTTTQGIFSTIDAGRSSAAQLINNQLTIAKQKMQAATSTSKSAIGTRTTYATTSSSSTTQAVFDWFAGVLWTMYFYVLSALRWAVTSLVIFYPLAVFLFVWLLHSLYKRLTAPRYDF